MVKLFFIILEKLLLIKNNMQQIALIASLSFIYSLDIVLPFVPLIHSYMLASWVVELHPCSLYILMKKKSFLMFFKVPQIHFSSYYVCSQCGKCLIMSIINCMRKEETFYEIKIILTSTSTSTRYSFKYHQFKSKCNFHLS
jgi:hypothetical protein